MHPPPTTRLPTAGHLRRVVLATALALVCLLLSPDLAGAQTPPDPVDPPTPPPTTASCNDGSGDPGGIGGYTASSECASLIAAAQSSTCTVGHSDVPSGDTDTLTYTCGLPTAESDLPPETVTVVPETGTAALGPWETTVVIAQPTPPQTWVQPIAAPFRCTGNGAGVSVEFARNGARQECETKLRQRVEDYGRYLVTLPDVLNATVRCDDALYNHRNRVWQAGGVTVWAQVDTVGSMNCTFLVRRLGTAPDPGGG